MANNLFANVPAACVAKQTISFASAGFNSTNTEIIYVVGSPIKSFVPGRPINGISGFVEGSGYWIVPKISMDKTAILIPPVPNCDEFSNLLVDSNGDFLVDSNGDNLITQ